MKKETAHEEVTKSPEKKEYVEVRIPRISFRNTPINVYLVAALVIFSFLLGWLTCKVLFVEKQLKAATAATAAAAANNPAAAPTEVEPPQVVDVAVGKLPLVGNKDAKVTVVAFSDFQCPFCKKYIDDSHGLMKKEYIDTGKIAFSFRHFPLTSIHPNAQISGEATECANEQNAFWDYHDLLFKNQDTWSPLTGDALMTSFVDMAGELNLDTDKFRSCVETHKYKKNVDDDVAAGTAVQVNGTPTFFINGYRMVGAQPYTELKKIIDQELAK